MKKSLKLFLKDINSAKWAIIILIAYFVFLKNYLYSTCPTVLVTGYPCPGCGMTRAAFAVLRLDFGRAWELHPFIYPIIGIAVIFAYQRYIVQTEDYTLIKRLILITAVGMIGFYIYRFIRYFPNQTPMTYYEHNFINRIISIIENMKK